MLVVKVLVLKLPFLSFHGLCRVLGVKLVSLQVREHSNSLCWPELCIKTARFQTRAQARLCLTSLRRQHRNKYHSPSSFQPTACLSFVSVQLIADGVGPPELLLQLAGTLHVHSIALLQEAHLPAQVSQILQLPLVRLH